MTQARKTMVQRSILFLSADLVFSSRLAGAARQLGANLQIVASLARLAEAIAVECPAVVLVDLTLPGLEIDQLMAHCRTAGAAPDVIAFGPHVHEARLAAAREAGCSLVLSRGQFNAQMDTLLARYL